MIIHIFGGTCSGKSTVLKQIEEHFDGREDSYIIWDVKEDFYVPNKILREDGTMDWNLWRDNEDNIAVALTEFLTKHRDKIIIIESSGLNRKINSAIKKQDTKIVPIYMGIPTPKQTIQRSIDRGTDKEASFEQNRRQVSRFWMISDELPKPFSIGAATDAIIEHIFHSKTGEEQTD